MEDNKNNIVNYSDNPNLKKVDNVLGLVVEKKSMGEGIKKFTWDEYSIIVDLNGFHLRCVVKLDSKQKQLIDQFNGLSNLVDVPKNWNIK